MRLAEDPQFFDLLATSYRRLLGVEPPFLLPGAPHTASWLYRDSPVCVLAHDTGPDPRFIYANRAAQTLFEYDWTEIVTLPSRLSAEAPATALPAAIPAFALPSPAGASASTMASCGSSRTMTARCAAWPRVSLNGATPKRP
jgi:hypothetical protein